MTSLSRDHSWVIVRKADGAVIAETFLRHVADAINRERYDVIGIREYLGNLNKRIRAGLA